MPRLFWTKKIKIFFDLGINLSGVIPIYYTDNKLTREMKGTERTAGAGFFHLLIVMEDDSHIQGGKLW